jgi:hypothetical protein
MDDGGRNSQYGSGIVIDISSFDKQMHDMLRTCMLERFQIEVTFHHRSGTNIKMYIRAKSALLFCDLIRPFVIDEMKYKLTK